MSPADANSFVVFGPTGDLATRKIFPALAKLRASRCLPERWNLIGAGRKPDMDDEAFRRLVREALERAGVPASVLEAWRDDDVFWQPLPDQEVAHARELGERLERLERSRDMPANRAFYLSLPPALFGPVAEMLGKADLARSSGWTRIVVEKPFGRDLPSARALNETLHRHFDESQIFRIDHYLGKETVQNLLVFRLANPIFESLWNRDHVDSVQILVAEELGIEERAGYYEKAGALRDMVQNHLTQLLTLVGMEVPAAVDADSIRYEKVKVLRSVSALQPEDVVFGQYESGSIEGRPVPGYRAEKDVAAGSSTETYVSLRLAVENWRWQGVPFVLRTGKRLARRTTKIALTFRHPPVCLFDSMGSGAMHSNVLLITLQPNEGFDLLFDVKRPGEPFDLQTLPLSFRYGDRFDGLPDAYETLLLDVMLGDQTLFVHADEVEASWKLYTPVLEMPERRVHPYPAGSWGPKQAEQHYFRGAPEWMEGFRAQARAMREAHA